MSAVQVSASWLALQTLQAENTSDDNPVQGTMATPSNKTAGNTSDDQIQVRNRPVFVPRIYLAAVQMVWLLPGAFDAAVATGSEQNHYERTARSPHVSGAAAAQSSAIIRNP